MNPAEREVGFRVGVERIRQCTESVRLGEVVAVEDEDVGRRGGGRAGSQRGGHTGVRLADEPDGTARGEVVELGDRVRVARAVVDRDDLDLLVLDDRVDALPKRGAVVVARHEHGDPRRHERIVRRATPDRTPFETG